MSVATSQQSRVTYQHVLHLVKRLSLDDQRRLQATLSQSLGIFLVRPNGSQTAMEQGQQMAEVIRATLDKDDGASLYETMELLRGRTWSS